MMDTHGRINLSRVRRCDQDWAAMPPMPGGRLCQQCAKRVVDFTRMSNAAIAQAHMESAVPVCGMYREEQLRPPRPRGHAQAGWRTRPTRFSLVSLLLLEPLVSPAQRVPTEQVAPHMDVHEHADEAVPVPDVVTGPVIIRGQVVEQGEPVPFVPVWVKGTPLTATTDFDGRFALDLTAGADTQQRVVLMMRYIGHGAMEQEVDLQRMADVTFKIEDGKADEITYSVTIKRIPLHKRIWRGMQRPFRK